MKLLLGVAAALLACSATAASATATTISGNLDGANYTIELPSPWNGTLVVIAHGYRDRADHPGEVDDTSSGSAALRFGLASAGYAVADTSYRSNGWAVKDMIADVVDLAEQFEATVATPQRTLLAGFSLGSFPTAERAERGGFDGYLPMCGVLAGAPRAWDAGTVNLNAYAAAFGGLPAAWGTVADGDDDVDFETEVVGPVVGSLIANPAAFEFMRIVSGVPLSSSYYPPTPPGVAPGVFTNFFFFTEARGELERRAGGPVVQNLDHGYWISPGNRLYLNALGLSNAQLDAWLATMNATRYAAPQKSRNWLEHYATFTGRITRPVLSMHTVVDTLVPANHEAAYAADVAAAGRSSLLRQWYTSGDRHCGFSFPQILAAVQALDAWVATGVAPAGPPALVPGFVPGFVPPAWPQP